MSVKKIKHYTALNYTDGSCRINLYFTDATESAYTGLDSLRARLILNILRNEKPVYWTEGPDILWTGREPVGEEEVAFNLDGWLSERPFVQDNILWEPASGIIQSYTSWSSGMRNSLRNAVAALLEGRSLGISDPPQLGVTPSGDETISTKFTQAVAWSIFIGHVAQSIVAEARQYVIWSLGELNSTELRLLFDSRSLFHWHASTATYAIHFDHGVVTPGDPAKTFEFLVANDLVGRSRLDTIGRIIDWCRSNLVHFSGGWQASNVYNQWQYYGFPPVKRVLEGTEDLSRPSSPLQHRTGGCWGTTGFLRAVLRTVNIPVTLETKCGHALPHFVREGRYLSHGDDPYNQLSKSTPPFPSSELLINQAKFNEWFGLGIPSDTVCNNIGRRPRELAIQYLPNYLLHKHCSDIAAGKDHSSSEVFEVLSRNYTLQELEVTNLWERMDAKIADFGGCDHVP
ncbi:MAG: hypothetical protein JSV50_09995 [Desulfobacteraceae bacterium]|nr:MAG: hypothetical protein JSV50_09995 [Desulfobacteraceae bacterium]